MRPIFMYSWYLLLIIFSFIIFFQLNKNKRITDELVLAHNELSEKNKVLETNVFQVKTLVKEVHHRVKNNLQIISSLLNLQGNTEEDSKVVNALQKSNNRIQSIALVHQKLYGTETLVQVDVYEYVAELIGNLSISLADDSKDLKIEIQISKELHFTMDTIIPLGLILNELITNSFKYAFTNLDSGTILIEIAHIQGNRYKLTFSDSGKGFDETIDIIKPKSLGLELIIMLSEQLKGSIMIDKKTATFEIEFQIL